MFKCLTIFILKNVLLVNINTLVCVTVVQIENIFKGDENNHSDFIYEPSLLGEPDVIIDITKPFRYIKKQNEKTFMTFKIHKMITLN